MSYHIKKIRHHLTFSWRQLYPRIFSISINSLLQFPKASRCFICLSNNCSICVTDDAVRRALRTLCKKAGIKYFPPHQFRFYGAMEMVNECDDIYAVSHYLGHTNLKTTQHYIDKLNRERVFDGLIRCS